MRLKPQPHLHPLCTQMFPDSFSDAFERYSKPMAGCAACRKPSEGRLQQLCEEVDERGGGGSGDGGGEGGGDLPDELGPEEGEEEDEEDDADEGEEQAAAEGEVSGK